MAGFMTRKCGFVVVAALTILNSSCVLPIPHRRVHVSGLEARVVSSADSSPVAGAEVRARHSTGKLIAVTDRNGEFSIKPIYGWHGAYLVGPVSYSLLPFFSMGSPGVMPPVAVSARGYTTKQCDGSDFPPSATDELVIELNPAP